MPRLSFAPKLRLAPVWPAAIALLLVAGLTLALVPGTLAEDAAEELEGTLKLVADSVPLPATGRAAADPRIQVRVRELAATTSYRITVIALEGTVIADSERTLEQVGQMDNHLSRPEVAEALARGHGRSVRSSDTLGYELAYAARLVSRPDGERAIVRLARPLSSLASLRRQLAGALLLSALLAAAIVVVLSGWFSRSLFAPFSALVRSAQRMGEGDERAPLAVPAEPELAALARALERIDRRAQGQLGALAAERDHLRSTVESMNEGVLVTDRQGRARLLNRAFRSLFGVSESVETDAVLDLIRQPRLADLIAHALTGRRTSSAEVELLEPEPRTLALLASPLAAGEGVVVVARDVTESERLSRIRKDFVANVSHELKTPLAAIRGYAETLVDGALDDRNTALRFSQRILEQCRRLGDLLDDLLTLSRLEGMEPIRTVERVDLRELAGEAAELVASAAAARQVTVAVEAGPPVPVNGDQDGLLRLISNLLDNAIKYNRPGGRVDLRVSSAEGSATIEVADTGIGIPAAHRTRIFERFYRVDKGRAREEGGTGLGLAIVKHVAQAHQGRVEVESGVREGSVFRVHLPLAGTDA